MRIWLLLLFSLCSAALADDFTTLCAERVAIEQVYYEHRTGTKLSFEQVLPRATLERLVRDELKKEDVLARAYGMKITEELLSAEVLRINTTTRAPEMLVEIKTALGDDSTRFANVFAKPILVERLLREKFDNDDNLHAPQRRQAEQTRHELLAAKAKGANIEKLLTLLQSSDSNSVIETTWQITASPAETNLPKAELLEVQKRFGPNAQLLSSPHADGTERKFYFADLPIELQNVLRVQLRKAGDVSAVIETPGGFLLYVAKEKTDTMLSVAGLSLPKRSYEQWLEEQNETKP